MKLLGIDYGDSKVGLALGDSVSGLSLPYQIIKNKNWQELIFEIKKLCQSEHIEQIVVGLPKQKTTTNTQQTGVVRDFISYLEEELEVTVKVYDESYTSAQAYKLGIIGDDDAVAAMIMLQSYLDAQKLNS
jgi:putative Holliday junction resolvase